MGFFIFMSFILINTQIITQRFDQVGLDDEIRPHAQA